MSAFFCGKSCQRANWKQHKRCCRVEDSQSGAHLPELDMHQVLAADDGKLKDLTELMGMAVGEYVNMMHNTAA